MYRELILAARLFALAFFATLLLIWAVGTAWGQEKPEGTWWDHPRVRACCSVADAVFADRWTVQPDGSILATVTEGTARTAEWASAIIGKTYLVPADRVIDVPGNPTGRALLFIGPNSHQLFCFAYGPLI